MKSIERCQTIRNQHYSQYYCLLKYKMILYLRYLFCQIVNYNYTLDKEIRNKDTMHILF